MSTRGYPFSSATLHVDTTIINLACCKLTSVLPTYLCTYICHIPIEMKLSLKSFTNVTRFGKIRCIVGTQCQNTDFICIQNYINTTTVQLRMCYCKQLINKLLMWLFSQMSISAQVVFNWLWWQLVKSKQAVTCLTMSFCGIWSIVKSHLR